MNRSYTFLPIILLAWNSYTLADPATNSHEFHHPEAFLTAIKDDKEAGKKIYEQFCANCHAQDPIISLGAPRIGVEADWKPRMKQTLEQMLAKIDPGLNAMPARGGCFECSDTELKAAIAYMLPKK